MRRRVLQKETLEVRPQEVRWIATDIPIEYLVYSNTQWRIE